LSELWNSRIDGCPGSPILEYRTAQQGHKTIEHVFTLVSGILDVPVTDKDRSFYDYLLVEEESNDDDIPAEALFDDLAVAGLVFPLNKFTRPRWTEQDPTVQRKVAVADIRDMTSDGRVITVVARIWGGTEINLVKGHQYRISPRLVDFNITKVLTTFVELDFHCTEEDDPTKVPFLQLIIDPKSFARDDDPAVLEELRSQGARIQRLFRQLRNLDVTSANYLVLKMSQQRAAQRILSNRLAVVWGPPGMYRPLASAQPA
jgi:hypothetical protein